MVSHIDLEDLPILTKKELCDVIDAEEDDWIELAKLMEFPENDIRKIKMESNTQSKSPSNTLISRWSLLYGHNTTELFKLLSIMRNEPAMKVIAHLVDERYHIWFPSRDKIPNAISRNHVISDNPEKVIRERFSGFSNIRGIDFNDLEKATKSFSRDHVIGQGGFGTVYKCLWLNTDVAVKKIEIIKENSPKEIMLSGLDELDLLNKCRHENIIPVYGYAIKDRFCYIVSQYMAGGTLHGRLANKNPVLSPLTWPQRYDIAKGVARGINFLHQQGDKPLIHGDIKPANILLDEFLVPKIGDFGLSREGHENDECQVISKAFGTKPYLPLEFCERKLFSTKVDVFSFGVVLMELATAMKSCDSSRKEIFLYDHIRKLELNSVEDVVKVIDKSVLFDRGCMIFCHFLIMVGKKCTEKNPNNRPNMLQIYEAIDNYKNAKAN